MAGLLLITSLSTAECSPISQYQNVRLFNDNELYLSSSIDADETKTLRDNIVCTLHLNKPSGL